MALQGQKRETWENKLFVLSDVFIYNCNCTVPGFWVPEVGTALCKEPPRYFHLHVQCEFSPVRQRQQEDYQKEANAASK